MTAKENRPAGETGRSSEDLSTGSNPSLNDRIDETRQLSNNPSPEEISDLVARHPRARAVNFEGYERGFLDGAAWADRTAESTAELTARKFYAMEVWEVDNRRRLQLDRGWFDVERARAAQGAHHG